MSTLKVTIIQSALHWHDSEANHRLFDRTLGATGDTDLIVLPEMFTTGFSMDAPVLAEPMNGPTVDWMRGQARAREAVVCGSVIIRHDDSYFNRFIAAEPSGELHCYDKRHLFRLANEQDHYAPGDRRIVFEVRGFRVCPMVCYDLRFPVWSRNRGDYDLLLYVANWPARRHQAWETLLRARAIENQCFVAAALSSTTWATTWRISARATARQPSRSILQISQDSATDSPSISTPIHSSSNDPAPSTTLPRENRRTAPGDASVTGATDKRDAGAGHVR